MTDLWPDTAFPTPSRLLPITDPSDCRLVLRGSAPPPKQQVMLRIQDGKTECLPAKPPAFFCRRWQTFVTVGKEVLPTGRRECQPHQRVGGIRHKPDFFSIFFAPVIDI